ncbi:hypothetical protein MCAP1_001128 [Malassezia caprae]|uniref:Uncharacterized protein n=1 Tax=Malassezia caprae TaxID=1381934 RepID=A0AAF0E5B0_9BASI|nr:hypothetical protein MCAP1_001128 [Malassezia caprae]
MIRGLEGFLQEAQLLQEESLSALKNTRLGIDLSYYLRHILSSKEMAEPLVTAIGGPPLALISHIEEDLRVLEQHRIKPVFVLNGLSPAKRTRPFSHEDRRPGLRNRAWEAYEAGNVTLANQNFAASNSVHFPDLYRSMLRMIRHRQIDYVVAPYQATGQLVLMERHAKQYVHAVYGPMELFAFDGMDNVILNMDLRQGKFQFASKRAILRELQCGEAEFLDTVLLAGMEYCSTFPALQDESTGLMHSRGGFMLCSQFAEHPMVAKNAYLDQFCHARAMIKFSLVLSPDGGVVVPLPLALHEKGPKPEIPSDLHEIFSFRLPDQVLLYLSRGLVSSSVLGSLLSGYVIESAPLDNGDTEEYHQFVREYLTEGATSPRCVAIALACGALHPFWRQRKVSAVYWFQPQADAPVPHDAPATQQLLAQNDQWHVPAALLDEELRRQSSSTIDLPLCLNTAADPARAQRTFAKKDTPVYLERKDEMVANTFWRMLELRGFLSAEHTHTAYGRALYVATQQLKINDRLQEPLYLALELIRAGVLHGEPYSGKSHSGGPSFGTDEEMQRALLAMRAMSLIPMAYKPRAWEAPLSRELLVFNSFAKSLSRSLRSLAEMVTLSLLLRSETRQQRDDYLDISLSLPFQADTNTGMGIVFKCYLDALYTLHGGPVQPGDEASADVAEAKSTVVDMLVETFENVRDIGHELRRAGRFWAALLAGVHVLAAEKAIDAHVVEQFQRADAQLQPMWLS